MKLEAGVKSTKVFATVEMELEGRRHANLVGMELEEGDSDA
jgi:hypothetical protein